MGIIYIIIGFLGGVLGGMGMGGGTLLVPLLSIVKVSQHTAQAINIISFIPMATVSLIIHCKNGLVKTEGIFALIISAGFFALAGSTFAVVIKGGILKKSFGCFLIFLSLFYLRENSRKINTKSLKLSKKNNKKNF